MQSLQAHSKPLATSGRRLTAQTALPYGCQSLVLGRGTNSRLSRCVPHGHGHPTAHQKFLRSHCMHLCRMYAAETVGSGIDRVHDVRRRSLKQSFEVSSVLSKHNRGCMCRATPASNNWPSKRHHHTSMMYRLLSVAYGGLWTAPDVYSRRDLNSSATYSACQCWVGM